LSTNKVYTEDDIHDLIGECLEIVRQSLRSSDPVIRQNAAQSLLASPITMALYRAQETKNQFPNALPSEKD
jgi:hypothetical protein